MLGAVTAAGAVGAPHGLSTAAPAAAATAGAHAGVKAAGWDPVSCPQQNLQAAINSAPAGATLAVTGDCTGRFTITKNLTIAGQGAVLDGGGTGTTLAITKRVQVRLVGLTITGGKTSYSVSSVLITTAGKTSRIVGGGIFIDDGGTVRLAGATVTGNTPDNWSPPGSVPSCSG